jgi:hypothetical protein
MPSRDTKLITMRVPNEDYFKWLELAAKNKQQISTFMKSCINSQIGISASKGLLIKEIQKEIQKPKPKKYKFPKFFEVFEFFYEKKSGDIVRDGMRTRSIKKIRLVDGKIKNIHKSIKSGFKIFCDVFAVITNYHIQINYLLTPFSVTKYLNVNNQVIKMYYIFGLRIARTIK